MTEGTKMVIVTKETGEPTGYAIKGARAAELIECATHWQDGAGNCRRGFRRLSKHGAKQAVAAMEATCPARNLGRGFLLSVDKRL